MDTSILITGASSGIGKALAFEMAKQGFNLGLVARRIDLLTEIRQAIMDKYPSQVVIKELDITDYDKIPGTLSHIAKELDGLDIVFANAGIGLGEKIGSSRFADAKRTIEVNLLGAMATVDAAVEYFLGRKKGHIVGTCSIAAFKGLPRLSSYCASKAGLAIYLESLRAEVYRKNIDVTILYPGYIDTPLNNMLSTRPFLISAEKGAKIIADLIQKKVKSSYVPPFPWNIASQILKILPTPITSRM